jgi:death-on-curing protein
MRYLRLGEVLLLHRRVIERSGGASGLRDQGALQSALAQPRASFGGQDLHPTLIDKAATLAFGLVQNHAFVDGNKRIGHAAMEVFLMLNGLEVSCGVDEQERVFLDLAAGHLSREQLARWLAEHVVRLAGAGAGGEEE